jgi:hypothetical protein
MKATIKIDNTEIIIDNDHITVIGANKSIGKIVETASVPTAIGIHRKRGYHKRLGSRHWTPQEDNQLRELAEKKYNTREIGRILTRTRNAIFCRMGKLGLQANPLFHRTKTTHKRWDILEDQQLKKMVIERTPYKEMARVLGRSYKSVDMRIRNMRKKGIIATGMI